MRASEAIRPLSTLKPMSNRATTNGWDTKALASSGQLWRLNTLGCLEIRSRPGRPIARDIAGELLHDLAAEGHWEPPMRAGKS